MKNIRIGNDISITWTIQRHGNPENFAGKNVVVKLLDAMQSESVISYTISDNVIHISFFGKEQKQIGVYTLLLVENAGLENMSTLDKVYAFRLVRHSCDATGQDECPNLTIASVELTSSISVGDINVVQRTGDSEVDVMSQNAVTQAILDSLHEKIVLDMADNNTMVIQHNLEYLPRVLVIDNNLHQCECEITYLDNNQVKVSWNGNLSGKIYIY